jgi:hypothetical protein
MKIHARQIAPEYQTSPIESTGYTFPGIIFDGNRDFISHTSPIYDRIIQVYDELAVEIQCIDARDGYAAYKTATEAINDYIPPYTYRDKPYTTRDIHAIREALRLYGTRDYYDGRYIIEMLNALTGGNWIQTTIRGCCQSDWQDIIYDSEKYTRDDIQQLEIEYFNTGSEWIIHDENTEPETPEEICGYSVYCYGWNDEQIRAEIADAAGVKPEDVILFKFSGYTQTAKYEEV